MHTRHNQPIVALAILTPFFSLFFLFSSPPATFRCTIVPFSGGSAWAAAVLQNNLLYLFPLSGCCVSGGGVAFSAD